MDSFLKLAQERDKLLKEKQSIEQKYQQVLKEQQENNNKIKGDAEMNFKNTIDQLQFELEEERKNKNKIVDEAVSKEIQKNSKLKEKKN